MASTKTARFIVVAKIQKLDLLTMKEMKKEPSTIPLLPEEYETKAWLYGEEGQEEALFLPGVLQGRPHQKKSPKSGLYGWAGALGQQPVMGCNLIDTGISIVFATGLKGPELEG